MCLTGGMSYVIAVHIQNENYENLDMRNMNFETNLYGLKYVFGIG